MAEPQVSDVLKDITSDIRTIVQGEIELAKAEMMPQVKRAGIGAGLFGVAGYLAFQAITLLFICGGFALSALYTGAMPINWAFTLGFLTMAVILLVVVAVLALVGKGMVAIKGPKEATEEARVTIDAVKQGAERGEANVEAIAAGAPRHGTLPATTMVTTSVAVPTQPDAPIR